MKNPQLENGYTRIANEIFEKLASFRISGEEWQVLLVIWRKTYGFNKKFDNISISQFFELTKMKKPSIIRAIKKLISKNIVSKRANGRLNQYSFIKHYASWKPLAKKLTYKKVSNIANIVSKKANKSLAKKLPTKDIKDTIQKKERANSLNLTKYQFLTLNKKFPDLDIKFELEKANDYLKTEGLVKNDYLAWFRNWLRRSIPNGKVKNGKKVNPIINDPDFKRLLDCDQTTNKGYGKYNAICNALDSRYPAYKFKAEWEEARKRL